LPPWKLVKFLKPGSRRALDTSYSSSSGFSPWILILRGPKPHRQKPVPLLPVKHSREKPWLSSHGLTIGGICKEGAIFQF
jgi:hypothetical protein